MNRAVRILLYLVGSLAILVGIPTFVYGMFVPAFVAETYLFMGALFFIGGIVIIWAAARTRKPKSTRQGVWRLA